MGRVFLREDEILKAGIFAKLSESPISLFYDRNKFQLFLLIKTIEKINQSPENCCKLMRALALSQTGVFVEELILKNRSVKPVLMRFS